MTTIYASQEILTAVFGSAANARHAIDDAVESGVTPQACIMSHVLEAVKCGYAGDVDSAFDACCAELGIAKS